MDSWGQPQSRNIITENFTGNGDIDITIDPDGKAFKPLCVFFHAGGAPGAGSISVKLDSVYGAAYDVELATIDLAGATDKAIHMDSNDMFFEPGDKLTLTWTNVSSVTYGLLVKYETP